MKPHMNLSLIHHLENMFIAFPDNEMIKGEYIEALFEYAYELLEEENYQDAKNYLKTADQYTHEHHHLKYLISELLLQIKEKEFSH